MEGPPPRASRRNQPCQHLAVELLPSRTGRERISVFQDTHFVVLCYNSPGKLRQTGKQVYFLPLQTRGCPAIWPTAASVLIPVVLTATAYRNHPFLIFSLKQDILPFNSYKTVTWAIVPGGSSLWLQKKLLRPKWDLMGESRAESLCLHSSHSTSIRVLLKSVSHVPAKTGDHLAPHHILSHWSVPRCPHLYPSGQPSEWQSHMALCMLPSLLSPRATAHYGGKQHTD